MGGRVRLRTRASWTEPRELHYETLLEASALTLYVKMEECDMCGVEVMRVREVRHFRK